MAFFCRLLLVMTFLVFYIGKNEKNVASKAKEGKKSQAAPAKPAKNKKNAAVPTKADSKATFTHSWLLTSLKGHTGPITDMDFSPNGKHLATCAEGIQFYYLIHVKTECNNS